MVVKRKMIYEADVNGKARVLARPSIMSHLRRRIVNYEW
jgi:hypothetical protein